MKQIIFALAFIYCIFCAGPAYNVEVRNEDSCSTGFIDADESFSTSTCVDRDLYDGGYIDRCCYIRFRKAGKMKHGCIGLKRELFMDVPEAIESIEKGKIKMLKRFEELKDSKIYELNCNSSYLKLFALSFALISLLF